MAAAASTRAATGSSGRTAPEMEYTGAGGGSSPPVNMFHADIALRLLLFATSLTAVIVLVTSKQTEPIFPDPTMPSFSVSVSATFQDSPAFIYLMAALVVTCFYSIVTLFTSAAAVRSSSPSTKLLFHLVLLDVLVAGVLAAATGAGIAVAYVGLKGNPHVQWDKISNVFDKFSRYTGSALGVSLLASIVLVALVVLSSYSLYRHSS